MINKLTYLFLVLFFFCTKTTFSQEKNTLGVNEFFTMHYYTFEGQMNQSKIDELEQSLLKMQFVSEAKVKYKPEKNSGQIVLVVKEKTVTSEVDKLFSPASIKQTMITNGLTPLEYSIGKYERK